MGVDVELDPLCLHLAHAAFDHLLGQLEIRDAIAQQATDAVLSLVHRDRVAGARQLLRRGHTGRPGPDHGDTLAGLVRRDLRLDPALFPGLLDDRQLDVLDRDRRVVDVQRTGGLARGRADPPSELGEVVGRVQDIDRRPPVALIDQIVPVGDQVVDRTALVTKRDPAVHAACALLADLLIRQRNGELVVVSDTIGDRRVAAIHPRDLFETCWLAHTFWSLEKGSNPFVHPKSVRTQKSSIGPETEVRPLFRAAQPMRSRSGGSLGLLLLRLHLGQCATVIDRHDLLELRQPAVPVS